MEWNNILRKLKLKEEAYIRLNRKIDMKNYMENDSQLPTLPSGKSSLIDCNSGNTTPLSREKSFGSKDDLSEEKSSDSVAPKREKTAKTISQQRTTSPKTNGESSHKQNEASSPDCRQIGEGRQGAIVDVRSIIADHRLRHPEAVPRRSLIWHNRDFFHQVYFAISLKIAKIIQRQYNIIIVKFNLLRSNWFKYFILLLKK